MHEVYETSPKTLLNRARVKLILDGKQRINDPPDADNEFTPIAYDNGNNIIVTYINNKEKAPIGSYLITSNESLSDSLSALGAAHHYEIARYAKILLYSYEFIKPSSEYLVKRFIQVDNVIFFYSPFAVRSVFNMPEMGPDPLILASKVSIEEIRLAQIWHEES